MLTQSFRFSNINTFLFVEATLLSLTLIGAAFIGFDISDEGLYAFLADPLQPNPQAVFNYDLFFKLIFSLTELKFSLIQLRLLRLLGYLIAAWSLALLTSTGNLNCIRKFANVRWRTLATDRSRLIPLFMIPLDLTCTRRRDGPRVWRTNVLWVPHYMVWAISCAAPHPVSV